MWSCFFCLSMIRHYVTAAMICSVTVSAASPTSVSGRCSPAPPVGRRMKRVTQQGLRERVCVCANTMRGTFGDMVAEAWMLVYPALEGVLAKPCVCLRACVWTRGCGHAALADGITALPGPPWLTGGGQGEGGKRRRKWDVSQRQSG